jgi:hypothetical protein
MQLTAEMIRETFRQTQREILAMSEDYSLRWERMAKVLNEKLALNRGGRTESMTYEDAVLAILDGTYYQHFDMIDRYILVMKAVEVMRDQPEIECNQFACKVGLTERNNQLGLTGWYMQAARRIIERMQKGKA